MKKVVRLTESDLHRIVESSVYSILKENIEDEGVFGNIWNGIKGVAQGTASQVGQQYQNAKANYYASQADGMNDQIEKKKQELETQKQKIQAQIDQLEVQQQSMRNKSNAAIDKANAMGQGNYGTGRQYQYKNQQPQEQPQVQPEQPQVQPQTQPQQVGRQRGANGRFVRRQ